MGCQCNNQKDEEINDEFLKKNSLEEGNEEEPYQDNNNNDQKEGIFGLANQEEIEQNQNQNLNIQNQQDQNQLRSSNNENNSNNLNNQEEQADIGYDIKKYEEEKNKKYSNYPEKMLQLINKIREDPVSYADDIEASIQNIIEEENNEDENKAKLIYKKKVKVALTRGEPAFREAAKKLRNILLYPLWNLNMIFASPYLNLKKK